MASKSKLRKSSWLVLKCRFWELSSREMFPIPKRSELSLIYLPPPKTLKQLRRVLGIFAYYRRFIPSFSEKAAPLYQQTKKSVMNPRDKSGIILSAESLKAFEELKKIITSEPIV